MIPFRLAMKDVSLTAYLVATDSKLLPMCSHVHVVVEGWTLTVTVAMTINKMMDDGSDSSFNSQT